MELTLAMRAVLATIARRSEGINGHTLRLDSIDKLRRRLDSRSRNLPSPLFRHTKPMLALSYLSAIIKVVNNKHLVNNKHRKTLALIWAEPVNGNLEWARIEALLKALGCRIIEGAGSSVTFESQDCKASIHRPHPGKEALRYRVIAVREFLHRIEAKS